ncbi:Transposon Tf2-6 poly [Paramuricea clavata]|uniref:Transposon Tf2-6 poly n=1 Tax=Paramuricea clavata TaxID=317549 RepID=A0A6S7G4D6_PARCT|nr:Transposon Tf2-6 poly [Paramuricea clavata]
MEKTFNLSQILDYGRALVRTDQQTKEIIKKDISDGLGFPHKDNQKCPAVDKECYKCHKRGHFARVCKTTGGATSSFQLVNKVDERHSSTHKSTSNSSSDSDSGSEHIEQQFNKHNKQAVQEGDLDRKALRQTTTQVQIPTTTSNSTSSNGEKMTKVCTSTPDTGRVSTLLEEYADVFEGVGHLKGFEQKLHIDDSVPPVAQTYRRIPFNLRPQLEKWLQESQDNDLIEPVVNKNLRSGYNQIVLNEESRGITTFTTHKGLFQWKRLPFGINSASEVFQNAIQHALQGLNGVKNIVDDIIVWGRTQKEHDANLQALLQRLRDTGLTAKKIGCQFTLYTDHQALEILSSAKAKQSARIQRWALRLQQYNYTVKYRPGTGNPADFLSRAPINEPSGQSIAEEYINFITEQAIPRTITWSEVQEATKNDKERQSVGRALQFAKWKDKSISAYFANSSPGTQGTFGNCQDQTKFENQAVVPPPTAPWSCIHVDFYGPAPTEEHLLVLLDETTGFPEVEIMNKTTAFHTIRAFEKVFARHGLPDTIKSDNGSPFQSKEVKDYLTTQGIHHHRVTPLWPQASGKVEGFMKPMGKAIRAAWAEGRDWQRELFAFLMNYRTTPHLSTGVAPSEMLYKRVIRSTVPSFSQAPANTAVERVLKGKAKSEQYVDTRRRTRKSTIKEGDTVLVKQKKKNKLQPCFVLNHTKLSMCDIPE